MFKYTHETWVSDLEPTASTPGDWAAWVWPLWLGAGIIVGGAMLLRDELRLWRTRPKLEAIRTYADQLEAAHGRDAYFVNGNAMHEAREAGDFARYRFLKAVSGELVSRFFVHPADRQSS